MDVERVICPPNVDKCGYLSNHLPTRGAARNYKDATHLQWNELFTPYPNLFWHQIFMDFAIFLFRKTPLKNYYPFRPGKTFSKAPGQLDKSQSFGTYQGNMLSSTCYFCIVIDICKILGENYKFSKHH